MSLMTLDIIYPTEEIYINYKRHILDKIQINFNK
jgi:hypothetical protein